MKTYSRIFTILIIIFLFYRCFLKEEINGGLRDTIDQRHELIDSLYNQLDSLHKVVDTLQWEKEMFDYSNLDTDILSAIIYVESKGNPQAYAPGEDAVGILQIRKCMVDDVNRILKRKKSPIRYNYTDRWNISKSYKMFDIYCNHYGLTTAEDIARGWNGGPRGVTNPSTINYWEKVQDYLDS